MPKTTHNSHFLQTFQTALVLGVAFLFLFTFSVIASSISPNDVITLVNSTREKEGLAPLIANAKLSAAAKAKANDMLKNDYFAHTSPEGVAPWSWFKKAGYNYKYAGENLAINYTSAKEQHSAWMKSATHRANILNAHYKEIGVATVEGKIDGEESIVTVQMFGTPVSVVADQSTSVTPPVAQPAEAVLPEVKGTEVAVDPAPSQPLLEPVFQASAPVATPSVFERGQKYAEATKSLALGQYQRMKDYLSHVDWGAVIESAWIATIAFLMLVLLIGPLAFVYEAGKALRETIQSRALQQGTVSHK